MVDRYANPMSARIPAGSVEYLTVAVTAPDPIDPAWSPAVAIVAAGSPEPTAFTAATWDGSAIRFLVGSAPFDLPAGTYDVWIRVTASPEVPVRRAGLLVIT